MIFLLSSISSGLEFWSVNNTSIYRDSELNAFKNAKFVGEICNNGPYDFLGTSICTTLGSC